MALVYSYIRFSTKKQLEGDSLRRQVEDGDEWIKQNKHTPASLTLRDIGVSAFRGKNKHTGALGTFLDLIESGRVQRGSILLVENLDRLSRQGVDEAFDLFKKILRSGVQVAVLKPYETVYTETHLSDFISLLMPLLYFHLAFIESKNKADRLRSRWDRKRKEAVGGKKFDRKCPRWVTWDGEQFVLNEGAKAVRFIFEATADGKGQRQVLAELVKHYKPIGISGRWNSSYITKVLNDRAVLGERQPKAFNNDGERIPVGRPIPCYYPAAIEEALWVKAEAARKAKVKMKGPSGQFVNLFVGLVFNANDGYAMHIQTSPNHDGSRQRRLVSYGHSSKVPGTDGVTVKYSAFEDAVLGHLWELKAEDLEAKGSVSLVRDKEQELSAYERRLGELEEAQADPHAEDINSLRTSARIVRGKIHELKGEIERLRAELNADQPLRQTHGVQKALESADDEQRHVLRLRLRSLLAELVKSIHVRPEKHFGRVFWSARVVFVNGTIRYIYRTPDGLDVSSQVIHPQTDETAKFNGPAFLFIELAKANTQPGDADEPKSIPPTVGDAAEAFLRVMRSQMHKDSFRVVPSKVRRIVEFLGEDLPTKNVNGVRWRKWTAWVRGEIEGGRLAAGTARVVWSRSREFVRWLIDRGACPPIDDLDMSSLKALAV